MKTLLVGDRSIMIDLEVQIQSPISMETASFPYPFTSPALIRRPNSPSFSTHCDDFSLRSSILLSFSGTSALSGCPPVPTVTYSSMFPRLSRVFRSVTTFSNLQRNNDFVRRDFYGLWARSYANVAAAVETTVKSNTDKPEVNLNKLFWSKPCSLALPNDSPHRIEDPQYDGVKRLILKLMLYYSKQSQFIRSSNAIYHRIIFQIDRPAIYDVFSLEKTFKTTFSLLVLHMWLCLRRLKAEGKEGVELGQYLYEMYNHDLELRVSKAGVNLLLSKWMKELERICYGNIVAYDEAIGEQNALQNVIWRNVFSEDGTSKPSEDVLLPVQAMTRYVRREATALSLTDKEALFSGNFMFTPLEDTKADAVNK